MRITFDPAKREKTLSERGFDFAIDAVEVFTGRHFTAEDKRLAYPEARFQSFGLLQGRMVMVVWTPDGEARRVISMRKCNDREQKKYRPALGQD